MASPRRAALEAGRGRWEEVRPAGRLGGDLLKVTDPTACSVVQLCLTLGDPIDCSLPGSSARVIFQARIQSGLSLSPPRDLPNP